MREEKKKELKAIVNFIDGSQDWSSYKEKLENWIENYKDECFKEEIEKARHKGRQEGYMIVKQFISQQIHQKAIDTKSALDLLDRLYDSEEKYLNKP